MPPEELSKQIQDTLATNEKVREGLVDEEALPFMAWGTAYADALAARLAAPETPEPGEEQVNEMAYALVRLMTRMNWLVTYRAKKDATWLTQTFQMVNKLSRDLFGETAPVFTDEEITIWLAGHSARSNGDLLQDLMARFSPPGLAASADEPPAAPLSDAVFGASLPGRSDPPDNPDLPLQPGENEYD